MHCFFPNYFLLPIEVLQKSQVQWRLTEIALIACKTEV